MYLTKRFMCCPLFILNHVFYQRYLHAYYSRVNLFKHFDKTQKAIQTKMWRKKYAFFVNINQSIDNMVVDCACNCSQKKHGPKK